MKVSTYTQMAQAHFFPKVAVQMGGCRLFICDLSFQCHLSVRTNNTRHIRGRRPAGHHNVKHVKYPAESKRLSELPINASTSQITAPGGLRVWRSTHRHQTPACVIATNFQNNTMDISSVLLLFFIALPTLWSSAQVLLVYYISPTQRKWTLFPSTSKDLGCTQAFRCAD